MKLTLPNQSTWNYLGKIILTAMLYYSTSRLGDVLTFIHSSTNEPFQAFWAPSGIAFAMVILLGRSVWPGILIGSLLRSPIIASVIGNNPEMINTGIVSLVVAGGRAIEPLIGSILLDKFFIGDKSLNNVANSLRFIVITLVISVIGPSTSATIVQVFRNDAIEIFLSRIVGWYMNNVFGILVFTPFIISLYQISKLESSAKKLIIIQAIVIIAIAGSLFLVDINELHQRIIGLKVAYLFVIPLLIWISYRYHLAISSISLISISIISVYFTSNDVGPFVLETSSDSAILLKLFMVTISFTTIISVGAANQRRIQVSQIEERAMELKNKNESLLKIMEDLEMERTKAEESDRLKSSFLANISHEIRTPMNAIVGFSELLNRENLSTKKREEFTAIIRQRSKDLMTVISDILDLSKIESGQIVSMASAGNIEELLNQLGKTLTAEVNHLHHKSIEVKINNELKEMENSVMADFPRLHQVFTNLLHNALKFTESGSIELGCKLKDRRTLVFYVRDTGIGIDSSNQEIIFRRFQQASLDIHQKYGGTGLGLAIVRGLLKLWDGEIWVESDKGKGSSFYFTMPYLPQIIN